MVIQNALKNKNISWDFFQEIFFIVEFNVFSKGLVIILVYESTNDSKGPIKGKFWKQLDELIEKSTK